MCPHSTIYVIIFLVCLEGVIFYVLLEVPGLWANFSSFPVTIRDGYEFLSVSIVVSSISLHLDLSK